MGNQEFSYSGGAVSRQLNHRVSGIYINAPQSNSQFTFKYAITVRSDVLNEPVCELTAFEIYNVLIPRMGQKYSIGKYDAVNFNCNHFTEEFVRILTGGRYGLPRYAHRLPYIASFFHRLIPEHYLKDNEQLPGSDGNAISDLNQNNRRTSSYALLCNENVFGWSNGIVVEEENVQVSERYDPEIAFAKV